MNRILIYGASGYTGKLCAREMLKSGIQPVLAARSHKVQSIAEELNCNYAIFDLTNKELLLKNLAEIDLVVNLAGPFGITQAPLIEACLATKSHYVDIAGEVKELQSAFLYDNQAKEAGIMIMPAAGFGVVPTDIAAKMAKDLLSDATHLTIAYATEGGASRGTLKTVLKDINRPGFKRVNHSLEVAYPAASDLDFVVTGKKFKGVYNPWRADLFTAGISTNIPNIETYSVFPGFIVSMMKGRFLWLRDLILNRLLRFLPEGPSDKQLHSGATYIIAIAKNRQGETEEVTIKGPEAYLFTARCLIEIAKKILGGSFAAGFQTSSYYGQAILDNIENVEIY